jgi:rhodanese-related sulfurtransferase
MQHTNFLRRKTVIRQIFLVTTILLLPVLGFASDNTLEQYISGFTYDSRVEMKVKSMQLIDMLEDGKAVLVDIRFKEEQQAWGPSFGLKIPLSELPARLDELPKDKIIVTACPHKDRAIIAMTYLRSKGIKARYLTDGLIGLAENLRGDSAKYFLLNMSGE